MTWEYKKLEAGRRLEDTTGIPLVDQKLVAPSHSSTPLAPLASCMSFGICPSGVLVTPSITVGLNDLCPSSADVPLAEAFQ